MSGTGIVRCREVAVLQRVTAFTGAMWLLLFAFCILWLATGLLQPVALSQEAPSEEPKGDAPVGSTGMLPAGHSFHGEVFNEGPRQAALLLEGMGNVHFPITTSNELAQRFFDQGVAQLHGFWYFESERSFRQVAALDPDCAMAYWGMAMSNPGNEKRAKGFIDKAVERKDKATDRERRYIEALHAYLNAGEGKNLERTEAYTRALEKLIYDYPDDIEAKAFLALHLWNGRNAGAKIQSYLAVDALLDQVFAVQPMHPAHHYRIHLWDYEKPERALASSVLCGPCLPGVAHMWHMPGHIYSRLKRYDDACYQQEASARVDHAHMMRFHVLPDQIHNFAHNNEWLIRNLIHVGRVRDALDFAKNLIELPQHPKYNTASRSGCSASYGRQRLWDVLRTFELWPEVVALAGTPYLEPTALEQEQIKRLRYLGIAYGHLGRMEELQGVIGELQTRLAAKKAELEEAGEKARQAAQAGNPDESKTAERIKQARQPMEATVRELDGALEEVSGWQAAARGDWAEALQHLQKAGGVDPFQLALVQLRAGHVEDALKAAREHVRQHQQEVQPLAWLTYLLWEAGEREEAKQVFEQLRAISADVDLCSPVFSRLAPIAQQLRFPEDWRLPRPTKSDIGHRPPLERLGPRRWEPPAAESWTLSDFHGNRHSLKDYHGQMLVVIFYLGYGCSHCQEQLGTFASMAGQFQENQIALIAIGTDSLSEPAKESADGEQSKFPFPILSDSSMEIFKKYRCYDDFERQPLHGTFLIDAQGRDVWHDISYTPFMDAKFVLQEAQRIRRLQEYAAVPTPTSQTSQ